MRPTDSRIELMGSLLGRQNLTPDPRPSTLELAFSPEAQGNAEHLGSEKGRLTASGPAVSRRTLQTCLKRRSVDGQDLTADRGGVREKILRVFDSFGCNESLEDRHSL